MNLQEKTEMFKIKQEYLKLKYVSYRLKFTLCVLLYKEAH